MLTLEVSPGSRADVVMGSSAQPRAEAASANETMPRRERSGNIVSAPIRVEGTRRFSGPEPAPLVGACAAPLGYDATQCCSVAIPARAKQVPRVDRGTDKHSRSSPTPYRGDCAEKPCNFLLHSLRLVAKNRSVKKF